jgi:translation initiation factor IF-2
MGKRLAQIANEYNISPKTLMQFLKELGQKSITPNTKIEDPDILKKIEEKYASSKKLKEEAEKKLKEIKKEKLKKVELTDVQKEETADNDIEESEEEEVILVADPTSSIEEDLQEKETKDKDKSEEKNLSQPTSEEKTIEEDKPQITGPKVLGKIDLEKPKRKKKKETVKEKQETKKEITEEKEKTSTKETTSATEIKTQETETIKNQEQEKIKETEVEKPKTESPKAETPSEPETKPAEPEEVLTERPHLEGPKVLGKIELKEEPKKVKKVVSSDEIEIKKSKKKKKTKPDKQKKESFKKEHKFDSKDKDKEDRYSKKKHKKDKKKNKYIKKEVKEEEVNKQLKETISKLTTRQKSKSVKYRREKRQAKRELLEKELQEQQQSNKIKVTEFITVSELASLMDVSPAEVVKVCMDLGLFVSINQRLEADIIPLIAENFGYEVEFKTIEDEIKEFEEVEEDNEEDLEPRPPIVTIMGHVDHGKTKLLDYIRNTNVVAGEAGGITQHIGAYTVDIEDKKITFIDTPGHEAFTAMRARGAQVTDIAVIVIAADDGIMPQTVEAINHAQAAGVEIIFAINKIDKPTANPDRVREQLANMNILVEEWGGKYMTQEISAKTGQGVDELLEKILTLAELMELKANPKAPASGTVIESSMEKGRGYLATLLVQRGTLHIRDLVVSGIYYGRVKAMYNEIGKKVEKATPSTPVQILGLDGAPDAGDKFKVVESDDIAKEITTKRKQLLREQSLKTRKHITLDELGRRLQMGNFQELNFIVKADVVGSAEAITDSILKLSTDELKVNVIHKAVGQITESDVMLAAASDAVIIGFNVRPSSGARKLAEHEQIDIRLYSIIYDALEDIKKAMEGMLSPEIKEEVLGSAEVLQVFKISKVGKVAGCKVIDGKIKKEANVRVIRDGIVIYDESV